MVDTLQSAVGENAKSERKNGRDRIAVGNLSRCVEGGGGVVKKAMSCTVFDFYLSYGWG